MSTDPNTGAVIPDPSDRRQPKPKFRLRFMTDEERKENRPSFILSPNSGRMQPVALRPAVMEVKLSPVDPWERIEIEMPEGFNRGPW